MGRHSLYDLDATEDLDAWDTHVIRSHRRIRTSDSRAIAFIVAVCVCAIAVTTNVVSSVPQRSTRAQAAVPPSVALVSPERPSTIATDPPTVPRERPTDVSRAQQTRPSPSEIAIGYALAQLGKRYVFGASGPDTFDCSGLVMRAFERIGIRLPHYTGTMLSYGKRVNRNELMRGDIIFPSSSHVGIYLGNNQMVAASNPRTGIKVSTIYSFYAARRLL